MQIDTRDKSCDFDANILFMITYWIMLEYGVPTFSVSLMSGYQKKFALFSAFASRYWKILIRNYIALTTLD